MGSDGDDSVLREDIINESFIKDVIQKKYGDTKSFRSYMCKVGTEKGDNFMGDLIACDIKVKDQEQNEEQILHWMIKVMKVGKGSKSIKEMNLFSREEAFYTQFQNDLDKYIKPNLLRIVPLIYSVNEPNREVLVFENLNALGYENPINKKSGFDEDHVHRVCKWLAELHGAAYVLFQRYPGGYAEWKKNNFFSEWLSTENFEKCWDSLDKDIGNMLDNLMNGSDNDALIKSFKHSFDDFFEKELKNGNVANILKERMYNSRSDFKTLCHGDPWFNNMMFKYNDAKQVEDVILLDMQIIYSGNIGSDLSYFLYSSVTYEDLTNKFDSYLEYYRKCLISFVNGIDPDIRVSLTLEDIKIDFLKSSFVGFIFSMSAFPLVIVDKNDVPNLNFTDIDLSNPEDIEFFSKEMNAQSKKLIQSNPNLYSRMMGTIRFFMESKGFDYLKNSSNSL